MLVIALMLELLDYRTKCGFSTASTDELRRINPEADSGARIDIAYRSSAGRQIIIELKRPGLKIDPYNLLRQVDKHP